MTIKSPSTCFRCLSRAQNKLVTKHVKVGLLDLCYMGHSRKHGQRSTELDDFCYWPSCLWYYGQVSNITWCKNKRLKYFLGRTLHTFCWSTITWVCSSCFIRSSYCVRNLDNSPTSNCRSASALSKDFLKWSAKLNGKFSKT